MKADHRVLSLILLIGLISSLSYTSEGQDIKKIGIPELEKILNAPDDKLFVVNFWATWCAPCVKELPLFEKAAGKYDKN
ncbi:MAG: TlpA family protein disulfide reductase [Bacteroidales bacterium]|nr:TlpA family protein disulfide reductase [Bacteroidales bacterium]